MEAELDEFPGGLATPGLNLQDQPLDITIVLLRKSVLRLESGRSRLEHTERSEQAQRLGLPMRASTRTVTATLVSNVCKSCQGSI